MARQGININITKKITEDALRTFSTKEVVLGSWQSPMVKDPQVPVGVPKLANLKAEIWVLVGHFNCAVAFLLWFASPPLDSTPKVGWSSDKWAQMTENIRFENLIWEGSPPFSSKITRMLPDGLNQDRGTWYLIHTDNKISMREREKEIRFYPCHTFLNNYQDMKIIDLLSKYLKCRNGWKLKLSLERVNILYFSPTST